MFVFLSFSTCNLDWPPYIQIFTADDLSWNYTPVSKHTRPAFRTRLDIPTVPTEHYLKVNQFKSDGLGCTLGVSLSLMLGATKRITHNKFHLLLFTMTLILLCIPNSRNLSAFSITLAIQRCNEVYKNIKVPYRRMSFRIPHQNISLCCNLFSLIIIDLTLWLTSLLLVCGDIETNPGPDSVGSRAPPAKICQQHHLNIIWILHNHLSIIHANVQTLAPKIDTVKLSHMTCLFSPKAG